MNIWMITAITVVILIALALIIMVIDGSRFVTRNYRIRSSKVSEKLTFVFVTDLHGKRYGKHNEKLLEEIKRVEPDAILAGGDLIVSREAGADKEGWMDAAVELLGALTGKYPVFLANGNHENKLADPEMGDFSRQYDAYMSKMEALGVITLHNESREMGDIRITGLELASSSYQKIKYHDLEENEVEEAIGPCKGDRFELVLAHNPKYFEHYADWGADLVLSGHVHGGLMRLGFRGAIAPDLHLFPRYSFGAYRIRKKSAEKGVRFQGAQIKNKQEGVVLSKKDAAMIVSCGLGSHTLPIRIFNPGELTVVHIEPDRVQ